MFGFTNVVYEGKFFEEQIDEEFNISVNQLLFSLLYRIDWRYLNYGQIIKQRRLEIKSILKYNEKHIQPKKPFALKGMIFFLNYFQTITSYGTLVIWSFEYFINI